MATNLPRLDIVILGPDANEKASLISKLVSYSGPDLKSFVTKSYEVFVTDSNSREDLISKIISNPRQIGCIVLLVSATESQLNNGRLAAEVLEQLAIAKTLGAERIIALVTQMEAIGWADDQWERLSRILRYDAAKTIGGDPAAMHIIPVEISGDNSTNLFTGSGIPIWFEGGFQGSSLLDFIDTLPAPADPSTRPLRW